jgi:hypothetical protein
VSEKTREVSLSGTMKAKLNKYGMLDLELCNCSSPNKLNLTSNEARGLKSLLNRGVDFLATIEQLERDKADLLSALDMLDKNKLTYEDESGILRVSLGDWARAMVTLTKHTPTTG